MTIRNKKGEVSGKKPVYRIRQGKIREDETRYHLNCEIYIVSCISDETKSVECHSTYIVFYNDVYTH